MKAGGRKFMKDPIHGYVEIRGVELALVDTETFQRLRRIKQLAGSEYVYPGAIHTRFEHSLGVMHLAGIMGASLLEDTGEDFVEALRIAGLLHDVGHGPFSHTFEPVLERKTGKTHEDLTVWLVRESELADILSAHGYDPRDISLLSIGVGGAPPYVAQVIRSAFDADKLDFTVRDSYHTGAGYMVDIHRLAMNIGVVEGKLGLSEKALPALEALLMTRVLLFRSIYYHKTSRAVQVMLEKAIDMIADDVLEIEEVIKDPERFIELDDCSVWEMLRRDQRSRPIIKSLMRRRLLKVVYEVVMYPRVEEGLIIRNPAVREGLREEISERAGVPREDVFIDTPSLRTLPSPEVAREPVIIFRGEKDEKVRVEVPVFSPVLESLERSVMSIVRVYTWPEHVAKVREAALKVLRREGFEYRVSM